MNASLKRHLILFALVLLICVAGSTFGQDAYYLSLAGEGTASVVIDREGQCAFITDGGHSGKRGITGATVEGASILDFLSSARVKDLYITCSHPHADHIAGLKQLAQDPCILTFRSVTIVDSGYPEADSLYKHFQRSLENATVSPVLKHMSAENSNAFGSLPAEGRSVEVENYVHQPKPGASIHGRAIIMQYKLSDGESTHHVVDFDDADDELVRKWADENSKLPRFREGYTAILPHHGSSGSDIELILKAHSPPSAVVMTVNPNNRYRHPGPANVLKAMDQLGDRNIHFTGTGENIHVNPRGVQNETAPKQSFDLLLRHQFNKLQGKEASLEDKIAALPDPPDRRITSKLNTYRSQLNALSKLEWRMTGGGGHTGEVPKMSYASLMGPSLPKSNAAAANVGAYMDLKSQRSESPSGGPPSPSSPGVSSRSQRRGQMHRMNRSGFPVFGGIVIGNVSRESIQITTATIVLRHEMDDWGDETVEPAIIVGLTGSDDALEYRGFSETELWAAYNYVSPSQDLVDTYLLEDGEPGLIGMSRNLGTTWEFGIHPAVADTLIARDGMRLDMFLSYLVHDEHRTINSDLAEFRDHLKALNADTYQWYDEESVIRAIGPHLVVEAATEPRDILLRLRLVKIGGPWWMESEDEFTREVLGRLAQQGLSESRATQADIEKIVRGMITEIQTQDIEYEANPHLPEVEREFDAFRRIDRFAKLVSVLNLLKDNLEDMPELPDSVEPSWIEVEPSMNGNQVWPESGLDSYLLDASPN